LRNTKNRRINNLGKTKFTR